MRVVVAAVKGVIQPWVAAAYVVAEVIVLIVVTVNTGGVNWAGLVEIALMITAATHTNLLDSDVVKIGRK